MGYYGKLEEKESAIKLRKIGYSYGEILKTIKVSKDTISRWCKDIELTQKQKNRLLEKKVNGQRKGSLVAAENKRHFRQERTRNIFIEAKRQLEGLTVRDKFITGIALYAAEGNKSDSNSSFANSDPKIIKFMMEWFRKFCNIPDNKFRGAIWLHENLDISRAINFWSKLTKIPKKQFHKTYIAGNKTNSNKIRKNIHSYGVFSIRFSSVDIQRKITGWISALFNDKIPHVV